MAIFPNYLNITAYMNLHQSLTTRGFQLFFLLNLFINQRMFRPEKMFSINLTLLTKLYSTHLKHKTNNSKLIENKIRPVPPTVTQSEFSFLFATEKKSLYRNLIYKNIPILRYITRIMTSRCLEHKTFSKTIGSINS